MATPVCSNYLNGGKAIRHIGHERRDLGPGSREECAVSNSHQAVEVVTEQGEKPSACGRNEMNPGNIAACAVEQIPQSADGAEMDGA